MDERATIIDIAREYKELVNNTLPIKIDKCWLYGSFAKGTPSKHSDIDIAMEIENIEDDLYWAILPLLWKLSYKVDNRIEPTLIVRDTDYAGFLDEIKKTGVEID